METTDYQKQATDFLARNGLKFRATLSDSKTAAWEPSGHHYRVTISRPKDAAALYRMPIDNFPQTMRPSRLVFDFWGSVADMEKGKTEIDAYSVLACISSDINTPETFADFCADYGYEVDSIKALQIFRRADRFGKRLREFFTDSEKEQLSEIQ